MTAYNDKLNDLKQKVSALTTAVNVLPTADQTKPVDVAAVTRAADAVDQAIKQLNS